MIFQLSGASLASKTQLMDIEYFHPFLSMQTQWVEELKVHPYPMSRWDGGSSMLHHWEYFSSTCWKSVADPTFPSSWVFAGCVPIYSQLPPNPQLNSSTFKLGPEGKCQQLWVSRNQKLLVPLRGPDYFPKTCANFLIWSPPLCEPLNPHYFSWPMHSN